jgi:hypothetical protein
MRILVTGSRDWPAGFLSWSKIAIKITEAAGDTPRSTVTVVHGAARGVDTYAHQAATVLGFTTEPHHADWDAPCQPECDHGGRRQRKDGRTYCPAAGNYRNQEMVDAGADVCLAFYIPGLPCVGTSDCDRRATEAGIPVVRIGKT